MTTTTDNRMRFRLFDLLRLKRAGDAMLSRTTDQYERMVICHGLVDIDQMLGNVIIGLGHMGKAW